VVRPGSGPKPTRGQTIKYDAIEWRDAFDGQNKRGEVRAREFLVSQFAEWWVQEVFTDMRVGEVRRVIVAAGLSVRGEVTLFGEYTLVAIL